MKKILAIVPLLACSLFQAQTHFGVKAGYNLSQLKWEDYKFDSKSYFYAGGFVEHYLNEKISLQGELLYTELGGSDETELTHIVGNEIINEGNIALKYHYPQIQIPVSVRYYPQEKLALSAGLNFGLNIGAKVDSSITYEGSPYGNIENEKTLNLFPFLGAGYRIIDNLSLEARYNFGFFNMHDSDLKVKSNFFQIGLGYRFN